MPNLCDNVVIFSHEDEEMMEKLIQAAEKNELLHSFVPAKNEGDEEKWFDWVYEHWGTKNEVDITGVKYEGKTIQITFESAWSPPIKFYSTMMEKGFQVKAAYIEVDMLLVGQFINGVHDHFDLCLEKYIHLPEFILSCYKEYIENYKEFIGI